MIIKLKNFLSRFLIPRYDELTLFLMSLALLLLFLTDKSLKSIFIVFFSDPDSRSFAYPLFVVILCLGGFMLSFYHIFVRSPKGENEKSLMLIYAVVMNAFSGIAAGKYLLEESNGWLMVFPIWNIINGLLLIYLTVIKDDYVNRIADEDADWRQILIGAAILAIVFLVCRYLRFYWAMTFSISVTYATTLNKTIQDSLSSKTKNLPSTVRKRKHSRKV